MKILLVSDSTKAGNWSGLLQARLPGAEVRVWDRAAEPWDADYALVWQPASDLFEKERNLKAIFNLGAGVDALLKLPNLPLNVPLIRLEDAGMAVQMAEYVLYHLVRLSRGMARYERQQRARTWQTRLPIKRHEWTVGVMGLGKMGARVAQALAALGYPVAGWARSAHHLEDVTCYTGEAALSDFLGRSRVLVNTLPLTPETRNILDRKHLSLLPSGGVLINVGRGEHLVEEDLLQLLDEDHLSAAILDVFREEPLPPQHPFWGHPAITITPHVAAKTLLEESIAQVSNKIQALEAGQSVTGVVDRHRAY